MSVDLTVYHPDRRWSIRPPEDLPAELVAARLRPLFPDLVLPDTTHPEVEFTRSAGRIFARCTLYVGHDGVRAVHTEVWDAAREQPVDGYRAELPTVIGPLQELARAAEARLVVEGEDMTEVPVAQIVDRVT